MQAIFDAFRNKCGKDSISCSFDNTAKEQNCHPWDFGLWQAKGQKWAVQLVKAALELPDFLGGEISDIKQRASRVKAEIVKAIYDGDDTKWHSVLNDDFNEALGRSIFVGTEEEGAGGV
ncbi:hypothetical protein EK21DRAFT_88073 [Setomelanomma holmii]|uniref:Uncharacterized protein n=1 Tax=Setomelanomma holmii TaxID=210430 RepID=A0A9P4HB14_9PLEO|nr:hypothetical protein EK21DRAFT_88073 [Setomelanomma holmii]